jgi:hypothetical protein
MGVVLVNVLSFGFAESGLNVAVTAKSIAETGDAKAPTRKPAAPQIPIVVRMA